MGDEDGTDSVGPKCSNKGLIASRDSEQLLIRVRWPSPNGLLLPWALVLGPGTAKLFIFFFFFSSFWVGSVLRNRNSSEKAPAAMSHS